MVLNPHVSLYQWPYLPAVRKTNQFLIEIMKSINVSTFYGSRFGVEFYTIAISLSCSSSSTSWCSSSSSSSSSSSYHRIYHIVLHTSDDENVFRAKSVESYTNGQGLRWMVYTSMSRLVQRHCILDWQFLTRADIEVYHLTVTVQSGKFQKVYT